MTELQKLILAWVAILIPTSIFIALAASRDVAFTFAVVWGVVAVADIFVVRRAWEVAPDGHTGNP